MDDEVAAIWMHMENTLRKSESKRIALGTNFFPGRCAVAGNAFIADGKTGMLSVRMERVVRLSFD
ncbi:hypothetical protein Z042_11695 [Chania multitudinisentens RB-25]|uniref:Uncharacterized protein n=1 Tax=Chania multitudinisentens RB-25 TaxID=1441930 RepID=W0LK08_9GAMM|nr:hypothetical protein [Chania multitudinisentens]AHG22764.1 hypothetical protein Z042_11695 [Chania multitudinisentens RB-25]